MKKTVSILLLLTCILCSCGTDDMEDFEDFKILMPPGVYVIETVNDIPEEEDYFNQIRFTRHIVRYAYDVDPDYDRLSTGKIIKKEGVFYIKMERQTYEARSRRITEIIFELKLKDMQSGYWTTCQLRKIE